MSQIQELQQGNDAELTYSRVAVTERNDEENIATYWSANAMYLLVLVSIRICVHARDHTVSMEYIAMLCAIFFVEEKTNTSRLVSGKTA